VLQEPLALESRRRIYCHISERPGTFMREMIRELDMQPGMLTYHLDQLEKSRLIRSETDGHWKRYYTTEGFPIRDRKIVAVVRQKVTGEILILLLENSTMTFQGLREKLQVAKSTLSHHLKKMTRYEIILSCKLERETAYRLVDPENVLNVLSCIRSSLEGDAADRLQSLWDTLSKR